MLLLQRAFVSVHCVSVLIRGLFCCCFTVIAFVLAVVVGLFACLQIKTPQKSEFFSQLKVVQVSGGSKTLFVVTDTGAVFACGEGQQGRLGIGNLGSANKPIQIEALKNIFIKKVAVHASGRHALALSQSGAVYSWGEGESGKLGHGDTK